MILNSLEKISQSAFTTRLKDELVKQVQFRVLVIEDDYVNYMLLKEMLSFLNIEVIRLNTLNEAYQESNLKIFVHLIIINISLTWPFNDKGLHFLKKTYDVPVIAVDCDMEKANRYEEIVKWADGVICLSSDKDHFEETISDILLINN